MPWKHWKLPAYSWQLLPVLSQRVSKVLLGHSRFSDALIAACAPLKTAYLGERDHAETTHRSKIWQPEMLGRKRSHDGVRRVSGMSLLYVLSSSNQFPCPRSVPRGRLQLEALDAMRCHAMSCDVMRCHAMSWVFADCQSSAEPRTSNTSAFLVEGSTIMRTSSARMNQYACCTLGRLGSWTSWESCPISIKPMEWKDGQISQHKTLVVFFSAFVSNYSGQWQKLQNAIQLKRTPLSRK